MFVANHQGSFDIFLIYGFLHGNFKWMMKKKSAQNAFCLKACEPPDIYLLYKSGPKKVIQTIEHARHVLQDGKFERYFPKVHVLLPVWDILRKVLSSGR